MGSDQEATTRAKHVKKPPEEMSREELLSYLKEITKELKMHQRAQKDLEPPQEPQVVDECLVCKGGVVQHFSLRYDHALGPAGTGPIPSKYRRVPNGYYCTGCGIKYQFPPHRGKGTDTDSQQPPLPLEEK